MQQEQALTDQEASRLKAKAAERCDPSHQPRADESVPCWDCCLDVILPPAKPSHCGHPKPPKDGPLPPGPPPIPKWCVLPAGHEGDHDYNRRMWG